MHFIRPHQTMLHRVRRHKGACIWLTGPCSDIKTTIGRSIEFDLLIKGINSYVLDFRELNSDVTGEAAEASRRVSAVASMFVDSGAIIVAPVPYVSRYNGKCDIEVNIPQDDQGNIQADLIFDAHLDVQSLVDQTWELLVHQGVIEV